MTLRSSEVVINLSAPIIYKGAPEIFLIEEIFCTRIYAEMAAASYSLDVLQTFYGPTPREENRSPPEPSNQRIHVINDRFKITQNNFQKWLRVWRMDIFETNLNNTELIRFGRENKEKFTDLVEQEAKKLKKCESEFCVRSKVFNRRRW